MGNLVVPSRPSQITWCYPKKKGGEGKPPPLKKIEKKKNPHYPSQTKAKGVHIPTIGKMPLKKLAMNNVTISYVKRHFSYHFARLLLTP